MKKIAVILLVLLMTVVMISSCIDNYGPIVDGTPPTYGEESTPARPTQTQPNDTENPSGGQEITLPIDPF